VGVYLILGASSKSSSLIASSSSLSSASDSYSLLNWLRRENLFKIKEPIYINIIIIKLKKRMHSVQKDIFLFSSLYTGLKLLLCCYFLFLCHWIHIFLKGCYFLKRNRIQKKNKVYLGFPRFPCQEESSEQWWLLSRNTFRNFRLFWTIIFHCFVIFLQQHSLLIHKNTLQ
jgi:hypothetical protein